jgi:hypothetical protein
MLTSSGSSASKMKQNSQSSLKRHQSFIRSSGRGLSNASVETTSVSTIFLTDESQK